MSRVPDDEEPLLPPPLLSPQPHLPKRKKRHSSLLDVFVSHQQVNKLRAEERARKQAEAVKKAEKEKAIAAAVAAVEPGPTAATAPQGAAPEAAAPQAVAPQGAAPQAAAPQAVAPQAAAPQAAATQAAAPQAAAPQAAAPQVVAPEAPKPEDAAHPAGPQVTTSEAAGKAPWTPADDVTLLSLKGQNKTWNEIADVLVGRTKNELRLRYKDIGPSQATAGPASTGGIAVNDGQAKNGKQQGPGGKKGKGKQVSMVGEQQGEASASASGPAPGPAPVYQRHFAPAPFHQQAIPPTPVYHGRSVGAPVSQQAPAPAPAAPFVWPRPPTVPLVDHEEAVVVTQRDLRIKGLLRRGEDNEIQFDNVTVPEGATDLNGAPIIYLDDYDPLNMDDLSYLYDMKCKFEERKWNWMASKLFDQTGKRIEPEWIKEKLQNCS